MTNDVVPVEESRGPYNVYTNEERKAFALAYAVTGNVKEIAEKLQLPERTLYGWVKADWWPRYLEEAKREHAELIEAGLSSLLTIAIEQLKDRIINGDCVLDRKGNPVRIPVRARDLGSIVSDSIDKLRLLQNKPSKVTAEVRFDATKLERNFAELADKYHDRIVSEQ